MNKNIFINCPFDELKEIAHNSISIEQLLKEGYIAAKDEDMAITNDFAYVDMEHWN